MVKTPPVEQGFSFRNMMYIYYKFNCCIKKTKVINKVYKS